jgi:hypothetical protein
MLMEMRDGNNLCTRIVKIGMTPEQVGKLL